MSEWDWDRQQGTSARARLGDLGIPRNMHLYWSSALTTKSGILLPIPLFMYGRKEFKMLTGPHLVGVRACHQHLPHALHHLRHALRPYCLFVA